MTDLGGTFSLGARTVHRFGFGAMQLPGKGVFGPPRDRDEAIAVVRQAVELGVDHIDTAQYYGPRVANELLREALAPFPEQLSIVSKVGADRDEKGGWHGADRPDQLRQGVLDNLSTLGVEQLAAVNLRLPDAAQGPAGVAFDDQLDAMVQMQEEGLIAGVGLSNITLEHLLAAVDRTEIACVQNPLNLLDRSSLPVLRACEERGIAFTPFFPLGSAFGGVNKVLTHPDVLAAADRLGVSAAQVALAWLLGFAPNILLIPGTSQRAHLAQNLAAADVELDADTRTRLNALA